MTKEDISNIFYRVKDRKKSIKGLSLKGLKPYYIIIGIIIILLTVLLILIGNTVRENPVISEYEYVLEDPQTVSETERNFPVPENNTEVIKPAAVVPERAPGPANAITSDDLPALFFVIDDVGNSVEQLRQFLKIPFPVTFAIMPDRKYSTQCAAMIKAAGKEYILHQPMEAVGGSNPGQSAIFNKMDETEILEILEHNFSQLPSAGGLNNHMGSAVTSNMASMNSVMKYLAENDLFYLDSLTISSSLGKDAAEKHGVKYTKRNSMFLDNENDHDSIQKAIDEGKKIAKKNGHAVMIGHVMTGELAEIMMELYPNFIEDGFSLREISELFIEMNSNGIEE